MRAASLPLLLLLTAVAGAAEPVLPVQRATYAVSWNGLPLGDAVVSLQRHGAAADCYRHQSTTEPLAAYRLFYGRPLAASVFCVREGRVVPRRFVFENPQTGERSGTLEFDAATAQMRNDRGATRAMPPNAQDRLSLQHAVRLWVLARGAQLAAGDSAEFTIVDDRYVKRYRFAFAGRERIETPAGPFETLRVHRVDDPQRSNQYWLAPARDFMPVQFEQGKGFNVVRLALKAP